MSTVTTKTETHVLRADLAQVVGSPTAGYVPAQITLDAMGRLRWFVPEGGGGGGAAWDFDEGAAATVYVLGDLDLTGGGA